MKCVLIGATRGCGFEVLLKLMAQGYTSYVLCRNPEQFQDTLKQRGIDVEATSYTISEKADATVVGKDKAIYVVPGDALNEEDVRNVFVQAGVGEVGFVMFSIGGRPVFTPNPFAPKLSPPSICTKAISTFMPVFTALYRASSTIQPRLVVISSNGLGRRGVRDLPWLLRPLYSWLLHEPHIDKEFMEETIHKAAGIEHCDFNSHGANEGTVQDVVIVRPALLGDGAESGLDAVRRGERLMGAWWISRIDVAAFIVKECFAGIDTWKNKGVTCAY